MSKEQYNLSKQTNYLKRTMFLDPEGPVTVQRFEEVKYPRLAKYEETARGFFWVPEEISLTKDKIDHKPRLIVFKVVHQAKCSVQ